MNLGRLAGALPLRARRLHPHPQPESHIERGLLLIVDGHRIRTHNPHARDASPAEGHAHGLRPLLRLERNGSCLQWTRLPLHKSAICPHPAHGRAPVQAMGHGAGLHAHLTAAAPPLADEARPAVADWLAAQRSEALGRSLDAGVRIQGEAGDVRRAGPRLLTRATVGYTCPHRQTADVAGRHGARPLRVLGLHAAFWRSLVAGTCLRASGGRDGDRAFRMSAAGTQCKIAASRRICTLNFRQQPSQ